MHIQKIRFAKTVDDILENTETSALQKGTNLKRDLNALQLEKFARNQKTSASVKP